MKGLKKFIIIAAISVFLEVGALFYINNIYLQEKMWGSNVDKAKEEFRIPYNALEPQVSSDGIYAIFFSDSKINIWNLESNTIKKLAVEKDTKVLYYFWLPGRNRVLLASSVKDNFKENLAFSLINLEEGEAKIKTTNIGSIAFEPSENKVLDVAFSTKQEKVYVNIGEAGDRTSIYELDYRGIISKIKDGLFSVENIEAWNSKDGCVVQEKIRGKIFALEGDKKQEYKTKEALKLLHVGQKDIIYLGKEQTGKIISITYGDAFGSGKFDNIKLKEPVKAEEIVFSPWGEIFVLKPLEGNIYSLTSDKNNTFIGKFIGFYNEGILSYSGGKIIKNQLIK